MLQSPEPVHCKVAMWVWTDLATHCPAAAAASLEQFLPALVNYASESQVSKMPSWPRSWANFSL